ncbi:MAG TPA: transposase [Patescibacteria group bacterium]|nr:transposase [Patescibacteria group bacterium]
MANTYSQIYIHTVFASEAGQSLIKKDCREEVQKYITGIVTRQKHKRLAIYCLPDHVHILVGFRPFMAISDLVREIRPALGKHFGPPGQVELAAHNDLSFRWMRHP